MTHRGLLVIVAVGALVSAPLMAQAGGRGGGHAGGRGAVFVRGPVGGAVVVQPPVRFAPAFPKVVVARPSVFPRPVDPWAFWPPVQRHFGHKQFGHKQFGHKQFGHNHFVHRPFNGAFVGSSAIPFGYGAAPGYYAYAATPDMTYAAPAAPAPSASMPTVVEYENGFYELRGDGITVAYRWVWIPKVPAPPDPPPAVAPPAPPAQAPSSPPAVAAEERPRKPSAVYRWTDDQGVTTYTDRLERVPARFRNQAKANALQ
jgi:Domain of unknown function (DUF4124)